MLVKLGMIYEEMDLLLCMVILRWMNYSIIRLNVTKMDVMIPRFLVDVVENMGQRQQPTDGRIRYHK